MPKTVSTARITRKIADRVLPRPSDYAPLKHSWRIDLVSGVTVAIVALPLALAFGISSGLDPAAGLVTAVVAGVVAAVFGGSNVQVSGPTGAMAVVLAPVVAAHGVGAVPLLSIMAGVMVLLMGVTGLGRAVSLVPWTVVEGFTLGIAAIIFLQQVPMALGQDGGGGHNPAVAAVEAIGRLDPGVAVYTLALVAGVWALILLLPKIHPAIPAGLVAVIAASLATYLLRLPVPTIGELPSSLPAPVLPHVDGALLGQLLQPALGIAALAAIEALLSARVASRMSDTGPYYPDRELSGQGLASIASGLFGGMPSTGAIARTAVNVRSGARTRVSAILHALLLLVVIYWAGGLVSHIPLAALAGVLMATSTRMVSGETIRSVLRARPSHAIVFFLTALITIAFDLIVAIQIGLLFAAFLALRQMAGQTGVRREELPGERQPGDERIALVRIDGAMFFGVADRIQREVNEFQGAEVVIIRLSHLNSLDATGVNALVDIVNAFERQEGVTVLLKGLQPEHEKMARAYGLVDALRNEKHLVPTLEEAVAHARSHIARGPWRDEPRS
ncbi:MAG: SulP family inorganic anion transporter [Pseudoclavibacter sp.]|nr:SulP family inorganic anion transporter [Pseudoclavibacter sp.]